MSPTAPTIVTLNNRLNKAHRRIRELEARNQTLRALNEELTNGDHRRTAEPVDRVKP